MNLKSYLFYDQTDDTEYYVRKIIEYEGRSTYCVSGKYSVADLLEQALEEYIKKNSYKKNK